MYTGEWGESISGNYTGSFFPSKKKNDKKREGPTRMQPLHTATRALFCHERKQTGNKLKIYACTRAQFPVRQMDRPTVRLTANRPFVKLIVSLLDVTMFPIFLLVVDRTHPFTDSPVGGETEKERN